MRPFTVHTGQAMVLRRDNVDTDQIMPAQFCKRLTKRGYADGLFANWRREPDFALDQPHLAESTILLAGNNFGTGSSREHAVWGLLDWGFAVVVAASFGDIFQRNALKNGLLAITLTPPDMTELATLLDHDPHLPVTVDLIARELSAGRFRQWFPIDERARDLLVKGLDDIAVTQQQTEHITRYETERRPWLPALRPGTPPRSAVREPQ
jgi:3-isopropylmalate/(R)-2-methylmalate dehydratase small subunit